MTTVMVMMLCFGAMALLLSAILVATSFAAMLARQVREIGIMKAVGARPAQIALHFAVMVGVIGTGAAAVAMAPGAIGALALCGAVAKMLNFTLTSEAIPGWVFAARALDDHGVGPGMITGRFAALPAPIRSALRRPARLALTVGLLASAGAMFMMAINAKQGWEAIVGKLYETRYSQLLHGRGSMTPLEHLRHLGALG